MSRLSANFVKLEKMRVRTRVRGKGRKSGGIGRKSEDGINELEKEDNVLDNLEEPDVKEEEEEEDKEIDSKSHRSS